VSHQFLRQGPVGGFIELLFQHLRRGLIIRARLLVDNADHFRIGVGFAGRGFVDGDYRGFILERYPDGAKPGPLVTVDGREVGTHDGLIGYTVGQRKGIAASGIGDGPWFVVKTDRTANAVIIGRRDDLVRDSVSCSRANVIRPDRFVDGEARGLAVCRYRSRPIPASATITGDALAVRLDEPVQVVSPGQLLVLYDRDGEEVLASGVIEE